MTDTTDIAHFQMEAEVRQIKIQLRLESDFHSASLFVFSIMSGFRVMLMNIDTLELNRLPIEQ